MALELHAIRDQTWALTKKNFQVTVVRSWAWTIFRGYLLPVVVAVLLLEIPNFTSKGETGGSGVPTTVLSLADTIDSSKKLALVQPSGSADDVKVVLDRIAAPLSDHQLLRLDSTDQIWDACKVDFQGDSDCHAVLTFTDSPASGRVNASWNYTIQVDPSRQSGNLNIVGHDTVWEKFWMPLQVAIDNAIANSTIMPDVYTYARSDQATIDKRRYHNQQVLVLSILRFVFYLSMLFVVHHICSIIAFERESGLSNLMDAMGGNIAWSRVFSYVFFFDMLYLPLWIILGSLFWYLLVPTTSAAITVVWQILTGWATTSSVVFAAAFFRKATPAVVVVFFVSFVLSAAFAYLEEAITFHPTGVAQMTVLGLLFPSVNFVYFLGFMVRAEGLGQSTDLSSPLPPIKDFYDQSENNLWVYHTGPFVLWILLIVQIIAYPFLAVLVEQMVHGNNRTRRDFNRDPEVEGTKVAIETAGLEMHYGPSIWRKIFCCAGRKSIVKAVDGLGLTSHKGQILCLLGPNGSGKTTTLDMIAGFQKPTGGSIKINALPSEIGVCPQNNVLWDELTVFEHIKFWNTLKGTRDDAAALEKLVKTCDLVKKRSTLSKHLSGGMKRKLQLACMLAGGSSVCLMDEVTSGLDPISRRVIWNAVLGERSRRTMIFTTHFLDESEVLSDHIVIVSLGKLKCQGTPAQLKNQYGAGYRVHLPKTTPVSGIPYPVTEHGDRYICTTPDSSSAARLLATLEDSRESENFITGPTIEDVFLKVSDEPHVVSDGPSEGKMVQHPSSRKEFATTPNQAAKSGMVFWSQFRALLLKRLIIMRSQWWAYLIALLISIIPPLLMRDTLASYVAPICENLIGATQTPTSSSLFLSDSLIIGPLTANQSVMYALNETSPYVKENHVYYYTTWPIAVNEFDNFTHYIDDHRVNISLGGMFVDNKTTPTLAMPGIGSYPLPSELNALINLFNVVRSGVVTHMYTGTLRSLSSYSSGNSFIFSIVFCLLMAIYPAFFCLYPTYERMSKVRALQYSNGIQALPLWLAYMTFDFTFVLIISVVCTAVISSYTTFWAIGNLWLVQFLYGIAAMLMSYIISTFASSQPAAIAWVTLINTVEYILSIITLVVIGENLTGDLRTLDGTTYGLGLIFPIQNLQRALSLSLNQYIVRCRGTTAINNPASFYAYGGPICLLIIQIIAFLSLLVWLDGNIFDFSRSRLSHRDEEKSATGSTGRPDVDAETARVEKSQSDLLRMVHVSKRFGTTQAVQDVSLGLREGEILALIGPNGGGKTTSVNMIRGHLAATSGSIMLEGVDVRKNKRLAQTHLGVCPQFDALDLLTVREHLNFYGRCRGVRDIKEDVRDVLHRVGLTAHAGKLASRLSGGQKRKLSLAIALVGNPPVLLLDEPSSAMDAASKRALWKTLAAVAPGRSVLITTHSMEEADALATRAAIIANRLLAIGTTQELRKRHSNEYHVHLILKSAPLSTKEEMERVSTWVVQRFLSPGSKVEFEGENLGGQVRFRVPTDAIVPGNDSPPKQQISGPSHVGGDDGLVSPVEQEVVDRGRSFVRYLIETLEEHKEELGLECYSIGAATMERVFLSVVKDSDTVEDEDEKKSFWEWLGFSRSQF